MAQKFKKKEDRKKESLNEKVATEHTQAGMDKLCLCYYNVLLRWGKLPTVGVGNCQTSA